MSQNDNEHIAPKFLPSFANNRKRKLTKTQENVKNHLDEFIINDLSSINPEKWHEINFEVGFGYGDTILHLAMQNPQNLYIGSEVYINGVLNLVKNLLEHNIKNIKIFKKDAREMLELFKEKSLDNIYLLFPDPWPKTKHHKRRIFNKQTLEIFYRILKQGGNVFFTTDHPSYKQWVAEQILNQSLFKWNCNHPNHFNNPWPWWVQTKYQKKANLQNRQTCYINLNKS